MGLLTCTGKVELEKLSLLLLLLLLSSSKLKLVLFALLLEPVFGEALNEIGQRVSDGDVRRWSGRGTRGGGYRKRARIGAGWRRLHLIVVVVVQTVVVGRGKALGVFL